MSAWQQTVLQREFTLGLLRRAVWGGWRTEVIFVTEQRKCSLLREPLHVYDDLDGKLHFASVLPLVKAPLRVCGLIIQDDDHCVNVVNGITKYRLRDDFQVVNSRDDRGG